MKGFIQTLKNIWSLKELRDKILVTLSLILVYRFASYISLPAINMAEVGDLLEHFQKQGGNKQAAGLLGLLSSFTGGAFSHASIMALGIMPYISASIIVQLMGMAVPYLQKLQKDGGYETISYDKAMYTKMLDKVAVIKLKPQNISCKIKVGQNLNDEKRDKLLEKLENRASNVDNETIKQIKFYNK